jgi:hypothetical protein
MSRFNAVHVHPYGVNVYPFATNSDCFDGLGWKDANKVALAEYLGFEFDPGDPSESLTIVQVEEEIFIPEFAAALIWASDDND